MPLFLIWWPAATQPEEQHDSARELPHKPVERRNANPSRCSRAPQSFTHFAFYGVLSMSWVVAGSNYWDRTGDSHAGPPRAARDPQPKRGKYLILRRPAPDPTINMPNNTDSYIVYGGAGPYSDYIRV